MIALEAHGSRYPVDTELGVPIAASALRVVIPLLSELRLREFHPAAVLLLADVLSFLFAQSYKVPSTSGSTNYEVYSAFVEDAVRLFEG